MARHMGLTKMDTNLIEYVTRLATEGKLAQGCAGFTYARAASGDHMVTLTLYVDPMEAFGIPGDEPAEAQESQETPTEDFRL